MRHARVGLILAALGALGLGLWVEGCLFAPDNCADLLVCPPKGAGGEGSTGVTGGNGGGSTSGNGGFDGATTSGSDVGSSTSTGSSGPTCTTASDCPGTSTVCSEVACLAGHCALHQLQPGGISYSQIYGDCQQAKCVNAALVFETSVDDVYDDGNPCTQDSCNAGVPSNQINLGAKCGAIGVCNSKGACVECIDNKTCDAGKPTCVNNHCSGSTCQNLISDGTETDVDCGGSGCGPCFQGQTCKVASDCLSKVCEDPFVGSPIKNCKVPACTDGVQNGTETDVDCGGNACPALSKCDVGKHCAVAGDCKSGVCQAGACKQPACNDGVKNGLETGVDCGAPGCILLKCPGT
jgi:hypothetical protein